MLRTICHGLIAHGTDIEIYNLQFAICNLPIRVLLPKQFHRIFRETEPPKIHVQGADGEDDIAHSPICFIVSPSGSSMPRCFLKQPELSFYGKPEEAASRGGGQQPGRKAPTFQAARNVVYNWTKMRRHGLCCRLRKRLRARRQRHFFIWNRHKIQTLFYHATRHKATIFLPHAFILC